MMIDIWVKVKEYVENKNLTKSLVDPSIVAAALNFTPEQLEIDQQTFGLLFENLVTGDLRADVEHNGGTLRH